MVGKLVTLGNLHINVIKNLIKKNLKVVVGGDIEKKKFWGKTSGGKGGFGGEGRGKNQVGWGRGKWGVRCGTRKKNAVCG